MPLSGVTRPERRRAVNIGFQVLWYCCSRNHHGTQKTEEMYRFKRSKPSHGEPSISSRSTAGLKRALQGPLISLEAESGSTTSLPEARFKQKDNEASSYPLVLSVVTFRQSATSQQDVWQQPPPTKG